LPKRTDTKVTFKENSWLTWMRQREPSSVLVLVIYWLSMTAKEMTLGEIGEMIERGFKAVADDIGRLDTRMDDLRVEMIDQFEHVDKQFETTHDQLRDVAAEIAVIHRRVERLEELGASNAGFSKEIDHLLTRVVAIEKHLGMGKKIAA
jgi:uncharacterized protein YktB (UPF0637 family)